MKQIQIEAQCDKPEENEGRGAAGMHITATPWLSSDRRPGIRACVGKVADARLQAQCVATHSFGKNI